MPKLFLNFSTLFHTPENPLWKQNTFCNSNINAFAKITPKSFPFFFFTLKGEITRDTRKTTKAIMNYLKNFIYKKVILFPLSQHYSQYDLNTRKISAKFFFFFSHTLPIGWGKSFSFRLHGKFLVYTPTFWQLLRKRLI